MEGSLNVLLQSEAAGIKNFVYMSSVVATADLRTRIPLGGKLSNDGTPIPAYTSLYYDILISILGCRLESSYERGRFETGCKFLCGLYCGENPCRTRRMGIRREISSR